MIQNILNNIMTILDPHKDQVKVQESLQIVDHIDIINLLLHNIEKNNITNPFLPMWKLLAISSNLPNMQISKILQLLNLVKMYMKLLMLLEKLNKK